MALDYTVIMSIVNTIDCEHSLAPDMSCDYTTVMRRILVIMLISVMVTQCTSSSNTSSNATGDPTSTPTVSNAKSWAYQLQSINVAAIGASKFDVVVVDYSADGDDATAFSAKNVTTMKGSGDAAKRVLAYMSIGEAEDYRYYFDAKASYMDQENPQFPGNFKVHYWESAWQSIIDSYVDRLIAAGFDGAYLDIVDAYEFFGPGGTSGLNRVSAAIDMVNFVRHIAQYARAKSPNFLIIPQNGSGILDASGLEDSYLEVINGIGAEDTFYYGSKDNNNALNEQTDTIAKLDRFVAKGKLVLAVDYLTDTAKVDDFYTRAKAKSYVPYATVRDLNVLSASVLP